MVPREELSTQMTSFHLNWVYVCVFLRVVYMTLGKYKMIWLPRSFSRIFTVIRSPPSFFLCIVLTPSPVKVPALLICLSSYLFCSSLCTRHEKLLFLCVVGQGNPRDSQNNIGYFCCFWLSARIRRQVTIAEDIVYFECSPRRIWAGSDLII